VVTVEEVDGVRVVRLANGPVNVLDLELLRHLTATFEALVDAPAVVLTGAGRAFSAGVDLRRLLDGGAAYTEAFLPALAGAFRAVFDHPRPVVAAVNGHAIAGGCVLAAACDTRLMSAGTIGVTELLVGVPFPPSALEAVRHVVGPATASLVLTGRTLSPAEARGIGLVDEVVEPAALLDAAVARARALAAIPAATFAVTKAQLRGETSRRIAAGDAELLPRVAEAWTAQPARDAIAAYLDRLAARRA
jgi:enoyl-CoA hydratase/carnithine racemase